MFKQIDCQEAAELIARNQPLILDVREAGAYQSAHIDGAIHLTMQALQDFVETTDTHRPVLVYCYHGITSQSVAEHLFEQGFTEVYSLVGGFEKWTQYHQTLEKKHDQ